VCVANGETALRLGSWLRLYRDASPRCVVVDHSVVVVPEHVLRRGRALQPATHRKLEQWVSSCGTRTRTAMGRALQLAINHKLEQRVSICGTRTRTAMGYGSATSNKSQIRAAGIELWYQNTHYNGVGLCN